MPDAAKYSEEELIELLRNSDTSAFAYLYDHYSGALYAVVFRLLDNRELAEDVLQEAFVKIWNNFSLYDTSKGRLFTWMVNVTRNLTIDTIRSKSYRKQSKIQNTEGSVSNSSGYADDATKFDAIGIRKFVGTLKSEQIQIIDLAYFEGLTQEEIAKKIGIPLGTVKTRMRTAIMELRKILHS